MKEYTNVFQSLVSANSICNERYRAGSEAAKNKQQYELTLAKVQRQLADLVDTSNKMNDIYKNVKSYAVNHKESVYKLLDEAIIEAGMLVPDADVNGVHLKKSENNTVTVVNGKGQNVNLREGGGYRAILGALLRYACTKAQPDALQLMVFDESFFTLSDTTTIGMKDVLQAMARDIVIVCIEQRRNICDGITKHVYQFTKGSDGCSRVTLKDDEEKLD